MAFEEVKMFKLFSDEVQHSCEYELNTAKTTMPFLVIMEFFLLSNMIQTNKIYSLVVTENTSAIVSMPAMTGPRE